MRNIIPLPPLPTDHLSYLRATYARCQRSDMYEDLEVARNRNVFIDDDRDFDWIIDHVLLPVGIPRDHVGNMYQEQHCRGINFNVIDSLGFVHAHIDINPTKLNILITSEMGSNIKFIDTGEEWDYHSPAILDVSQWHTVTNISQLSMPRVMLQIFLLHPFETYRQLLS